MLVERRVFRQADFTRTAVDNVVEAVRYGTVWVFVILLSLASVRMSLITLTTIPHSMLVAILVFGGLRVSINIITLGGIAVAVGELVDDAVVNVENVYRRLRGNRQSPYPAPTLLVVYRASREVQNSIVYATLIVCLVVTPLFALSGLEGRMFAPLGLANLVSLTASLAVPLTVPSALASYLLPPSVECWRGGDPPVLRGLKWAVRRVFGLALRHARPILVVTLLLSAFSRFAVLGMGSEFLPPFHERTVTVILQLSPGTSLAERSRVAGRAEQANLPIPEVAAVSRRTGRAEQDEHAEWASRSDPVVIGLTVPGTPSGRKVPVVHVADMLDTTKPHTLNRENVRRRVVASCNVQGRSLGGVVTDLPAAVSPVEGRLRAKGCADRIEFDGQFRAQQERTPGSCPAARPRRSASS